MDRMRQYRRTEMRGALEALEISAARYKRRKLDGHIGRGASASSDVGQLIIGGGRNLRDPSDGEMWFVVGYSKVGGPDKIPPE